MNKPSKCITTSGDQPNTPCIFPWKYKDEPWVYNGCANPGGYSGGHWCPTELTDGRWPAGSDKWGHCDMTLSECSNGKVEEFLSNLIKALIGSGRVSSGHGCSPPDPYLTWTELSFDSSTRVNLSLPMGIWYAARCSAAVIAPPAEAAETVVALRVNPRGNLTWLEDFSTRFIKLPDLKLEP